MNGVASEIAIEVGVLLQHRHGYPGSREQITSHHSSRSTADDHATCLNFLRHRNSSSQGTTDYLPPPSLRRAGADSTDKEIEITIIALHPCYSCNPWLNE